MLNLLCPDITPNGVYANSFGDALKRLKDGYDIINNELKKDNISSTRRSRLGSYLTDEYLPKCLVVFQPDDMAAVISYAQGLKEAADAEVSVVD